MIRLARPDEVALLPAIELSAGRLFVEHGFGDKLRAAPAEQWRPCQEAGLLWMVEGSGGAPVAFLAGHIHEDVFFVSELDVGYEHQRQGLGRQLMAVAEQDARRRGLAQMALVTSRTPPWNAPFYASLGYAIAERPPPWLARILALEASRGAEDRCGMLKSLAE
jgi:GNAT superfamily N-acetyltransferase